VALIFNEGSISAGGVFGEKLRLVIRRLSSRKPVKGAMKRAVDGGAIGTDEFCFKFVAVRRGEGRNGEGYGAGVGA
jgi:hypothetical protein